MGSVDIVVDQRVQSESTRVHKAVGSASTESRTCVLSPRAGKRPENVTEWATSFALVTRSGLVYKAVEPKPLRNWLPWHGFPPAVHFNESI